MAGCMISEYVSGGYYLAVRPKRPSYISAELIPETVLSASPCICDFLPGDWTIEWASVNANTRLEEAEKFGIAAFGLPALVAWGTAAFSIAFGWPSAFYRLDDARDARAKLLAKESDIVIFGLGLHVSDVADFLAVAKPPEAAPGFAPIGETGVYQCVNAGNQVDEFGHTAGFELLATYSGLITCSWLCNGLETDCARELGVRTNSEGFVPTRADAVRCAEYIGRDEVGAEPGLWLPWLITTYSER